MPVQPVSGRGQEDRSLAAFADRQVDGPCRPQGERDDGFLAALAHDSQGAVAAVQAEHFNVVSDGLGDPLWPSLSFTDPADTDAAVSYGPADRVIISTHDSDMRAIEVTFTTLAQAALPPADSVGLISDLINKFR